MTLIRRSLYKELVTSRDELLSTLNTTKASLKTTEASLTTEQTKALDAAIAESLGP